MTVRGLCQGNERGRKQVVMGSIAGSGVLFSFFYFLFLEP